LGCGTISHRAIVLNTLIWTTRPNNLELSPVTGLAASAASFAIR
jgi:hypothetical protein